MRYSNTAITELSAKYRSVLKKCALLNAAILLSTAVALPAMAGDARIGDTDYDTLAEAVNAVATDETIIMQTDVAEAVGITVPKGAKFTIDFNGNSYNLRGPMAGSSGTETQGFQLNGVAPVSGDIVIEKGTITADKYYADVHTGTRPVNLINNYTNLTLDTMVLDGTNLAVGYYKKPSNQKIYIGPTYTFVSEGGVSTITNSKIISRSAEIVTPSEARTSASNWIGGDSLADYGIDGDNTKNGAMMVAYYPDTNHGPVEVTLKDSEIIGNIDIRTEPATAPLGDNIDKAVLNLVGTNKVTGDIRNDGTLNIAGALELNGKISNFTSEGKGVVTFASGSSLTALLNGSTIISGMEIITGNTELVLGNGADGQSFALQATTNNLNFKENSLYSFEKAVDGTTTTYTINKKATDNVVEDLVEKGATAQEAATISAIADTKVSNPVLDKITEAVQSGDVKTAAKAAKDLAPTTSQAALGISKDVQSLLTNAATARMASLAGRSGGDVFKGGSMWVQGLFNHTKQDSTSHNEGFKANSKGIAFGIDGKLNDAVTVGLGYGYTRTDADAGNRDIDVDGNNFFAYAEYAPDAWYVNGVLNFGYGRYTEKKSPMGYTKKSKYDVYTYGANLMTGYAFDSGLTPEGGLRYLLVDQKSYDDGIQKISTKNNDVLTAVLGAKYGYKVKAKDWMFTPNVRLAVTYDLMSDSSKAVSSITGGSSYQITGERLHRLGFEAGVGVTSTWNNWDFTLSYDGGFRKDYQSHTGTLKAKYHF